MDTKQKIIDAFQIIPGVGKSIARDLYDLGFRRIADLAGQDPDLLYVRSNDLKNQVQDICLLYTFRCAVRYADLTTATATADDQDPNTLKWWHFMDNPRTDSRTKDTQIRQSKHLPPLADA